MARTTQGSESLDLENMSDEQLRAIQARARELLDERVRSRIDEFRRIARDAGYELSLTRIGEEPRRRGRPREGTQQQDQRRGPLPPKYRNPENPSEIWSGRGIAPKWLRDQMERTGKSRDEFLIEPEERLPLGEEAPSRS
jgi:DNA-binding protein H-NS